MINNWKKERKKTPVTFDSSFHVFIFVEILKYIGLSGVYGWSAS